MKMIRIVLSLSLLFTLVTSFTKPGKEQNQSDIGLNPGKTAPELVCKDTADKPLALSSLRGKLVLIDFWASWCFPCRRENPNVVAVYQKFKDTRFKNGKGFTIYSVSLDQNKAAWLRAIKQDKLEWPYHVSDLAGWQSEPARKYNINVIPSNVLIDGDGKILGLNLRGEALGAELEKYKK